MSRIIDEHRQYLADEPRLAAFSQAIAEVVKPGDVVLDLGCGTGIMGLLACRAGAARVYALDSTGMIEIARLAARTNGFQDRITFIKDFSTHAQLPEKVDVVVADQIGRFGFEAGVVQYFADARLRFLKPGGRMIPNYIEMCAAAVDAPEMRSQVEFWREQQPVGFNFAPVRTRAANTGYPIKYEPEQILSEPRKLGSFDLLTTQAKPFDGECVLTITRPGTLHGIGGWFWAQLSPSSILTNSPLSGVQRINRHNVFLPVDRPVEVLPGDVVNVKMRVSPAEVMLTWRVLVQRPNGAGLQKQASFVHSVFQGMLTAQEDLQRTNPKFVPHLTPRGVARLTVLELCDGQRALADIEQGVFQRHPQLFRSPGDAAKFVAEVVTRYAV